MDEEKKPLANSVLGEKGSLGAAEEEPEEGRQDESESELVNERLSDEYLNEKFERLLNAREEELHQQRRRVIMMAYLMVLSLAVAGLLGLSFFWPIFFEETRSKLVQYSSGISALAVVFTLVVTYLQSGELKNTQEVETDTRAEKKISQKLSGDLFLKYLKKKEREDSPSAKPIQYIIRTSNRKSKSSNTFNPSVSFQESRYRSLHNEFQSKKSRLLSEIERLGLRANVNLGIGVIITLTAMSVLFLMVFKPSFEAGGSPRIVDFLVYYIPRISLVIFIELFAFFFLRLYRSGLADIKYYQDELTVVESRYMALLIAMGREDEELIRVVVERLACVERTQVLEKGQTTVEIERSRISSLEIVELAQRGEGILKGILSKKG